MGTCRYCGKSAGLFSSRHPDCEQKFTAAKAAVPLAIQRWWRDEASIPNLGATLSKIASNGMLDEGSKKEEAFVGLHSVLNHILEDRVLTEEEETRFQSLCDLMGLSQADVQGQGFTEPLSKAALLRDLENEIIKSRVKIDGNLPVILGRGEQVLWAFNDVQLFEHRTKSHFVGRSSGISVRVMKGVYVRTGASRGEKISYQELQHIDTGLCILSDVNWFFVGTKKQAKIPLKSVMSVKAFSDAVEVTRSSVNAKPSLYAVPDPEFAATAIARAASLIR